MTGAPIDRPTHAIRDNPALNRYELLVDERLIGIAEYRRVDGTLVLPHTEILASERESGWGDVLVGATLDDIRRQGLQIVPQCWFVAEFVDRNPQYADLLA